MFALATKVYRPEGVSVAHIEPAKVANMDCWRWGTELHTYARSQAEEMRTRKVLRDGQFTLTAAKRSGYFILTAWPIE